MLKCTSLSFDPGPGKCDVGCDALTSSPLFWNSLTRLKLPNLRGEDFLKQLPTYCPSLERLNLRNCSQITDPWVQSLVENCPNLRELKLDECQSLTPSILDTVLKARSQISLLSIIDCPNITHDDLIRQRVERFPGSSYDSEKPHSLSMPTLSNARLVMVYTEPFAMRNLIIHFNHIEKKRKKKRKDLYTEASAIEELDNART